MDNNARSLEEGVPLIYADNVNFVGLDPCKVIVAVSGLSPIIGDNHLATIFGIIGPIASVKVLTDNSTGLGKGVAFVRYLHEQHASKAAALDGFFDPLTHSRLIVRPYSAFDPKSNVIQLGSPPTHLIQSMHPAAADIICPKHRLVDQQKCRDVPSFSAASDPLPPGAENWTTRTGGSRVLDLSEQMGSSLLDSLGEHRARGNDEEEIEKIKNKEKWKERSNRSEQKWGGNDQCEKQQETRSPLSAQQEQRGYLYLPKTQCTIDPIYFDCTIEDDTARGDDYAFAKSPAEKLAKEFAETKLNSVERMKKILELIRENKQN